jgi:hypothetical protein
MAIKGKGKARARRAVTAGPKPMYVPVKKPLLARRSVQIGLGLLVLAALAGGLLYGFAKQRSNDRLERERAAVQQFGALIEQILTPVGQPLPPTNFEVFQELELDIAQLKAGDLDPSQAINRAISFAKSAGDTAAAVENINAADLVRDGGLPISLLDTKANVLAALQIYQQTAVTLRLAAEAGPGEQRDDLIAVAEGLIATADELFEDGYRKLNIERNRLGILEATPLQPGVVPGG